MLRDSWSINDYINEGHYLAFVDYVGNTVDGKHIYRFDFTQATDVVWGENWNVTPAGIVPNISPDQNCLSITAQVLVDGYTYRLAKDNTCFSMQDCIDGILPLLFDDPYGEEPLNLPFGMPLEDVIDAIGQWKLELINPKNVNEERDNEVIDGLIDNLETQINQTQDDDGLDDEDF